MEERKEYSVIGTVTIGTDEYRDLIEERIRLEKERDEYNNKWYREYCDCNKLKEENTKLREELDKMKKFIKNSVTTDDNSITLFMSMFGEE